MNTRSGTLIHPLLSAIPMAMMIASSTPAVARAPQRAFVSVPASVSTVLRQRAFPSTRPRPRIPPHRAAHAPTSVSPVFAQTPGISSVPADHSLQACAFAPRPVYWK